MGGDGRPDDAERPTLLVESNMHAREWLAIKFRVP